MATTRHATRARMVQSARQLRSGRLVKSPSTTRATNLRSCYVHKSYPVGTSTSDKANNLGGMPRRKRNAASTKLSDTGDAVQEIETNPQIIPAGGRQPPLFDTALRESSILPPCSSVSSLSSLSTTMTQPTSLDVVDSGVDSQVEDSQDETAGGLKVLSIDPEDIGVPPDHLWDQSAAYDQRFCFIHGEREFLLGTPDRWMRCKDFGSAVSEKEMDALLQKHKDSPSEFEPHSRHCQAECTGSLRSHIHSVIYKAKCGQENAFLVRWKACWTPESDIDDKNWIEASLQLHKNRECRRSERLRTTADHRRKINEAIMLVVDLE